MLPPEQPLIETSRLRIRLLEESDLPALWAVNADDEVTRYLPFASWATGADAKAWYERMALRHAAGDARQFVVVQRDSGAIIGTCLLFRYEKASARAELGYALARDCWGRGYMVETLCGVVAYAFERLNLRRLEAEIDPRNLASARLLERLGFVREGLLRQRWDLKGEVTDSGLYGLLRAEWSAACCAPGASSPA